MTDNNTGQTQDQTELARCECGAEANNASETGDWMTGMEWRQGCTQCPRAVIAETAAEARRLWNRAHSPRGVSAVEAILSQAVKHLQTWLDLDECECEMGEHRCGRDEVEQTVSASIAALEAGNE